MLAEEFCDFFGVGAYQVHLGAQCPKVIQGKKSIQRCCCWAIIPIREKLYILSKRDFIFSK
jgi:hypothetical protein